MSQAQEVHLFPSQWSLSFSPLEIIGFVDDGSNIVNFVIPLVNVVGMRSGPSNLTTKILPVSPFVFQFMILEDAISIE